MWLTRKLSWFSGIMSAESCFAGIMSPSHASLGNVPESWFVGIMSDESWFAGIICAE